MYFVPKRKQCLPIYSYLLPTSSGRSSHVSSHLYQLNFRKFRSRKRARRLVHRVKQRDRTLRLFETMFLSRVRFKFYARYDSLMHDRKSVSLNKLIIQIFFLFSNLVKLNSNRYMGICCSNRWNGMYKKDTEDQSFAKVLPLIAGTWTQFD